MAKPDTRLTVDRIIDLLTDGRPRTVREIDFALGEPRDLHDQLRLLRSEDRILANGAGGFSLPKERWPKCG